jgi:hypothetical protein
MSSSARHLVKDLMTIIGDSDPEHTLAHPEKGLSWKQYWRTAFNSDSPSLDKNPLTAESTNEAGVSVLDGEDLGAGTVHSK